MVGRRVSESLYEHPVKLEVAFQAPDPAVIVLQGPALEAYYEWKSSGSWEDEDYLNDLIMEQCEDYVAGFTLLDDWREV